MNLDLINNVINDVKNNKFIQSFIKELENYLEKNTLNNEKNIKKGDITMVNPTDNSNKITSEYRDKLLIQRAHILNNYAKQTANKGQMFFIYDKNSKMQDGYNLCICDEEKSHSVIVASSEELPNGSQIGSVLRMTGNAYVLDEEATKDINKELYNIENKLLQEQSEFLNSKRIEGHIYEMSENNGDRALLFDLTDKSEEGIEEINFPKELLENSKEGDLFIFKNGEYQKYYY